MTQIITDGPGSREQIREAWRNSEPFIIVKPRRKYGMVWWSSDPAYPYYNSGNYFTEDAFQGLQEIVSAYSLENAAYGIASGYVGKINLGVIYDFAERLRVFLNQNIVPVDWPWRKGKSDG